VRGSSRRVGRSKGVTKAGHVLFQRLGLETDENKSHTAWRWRNLGLQLFIRGMFCSHAGSAACHDSRTPKRLLQRGYCRSLGIFFCSAILYWGGIARRV